MKRIVLHLIDDDAAVLDSLGDFLEGRGLTVHRHPRADVALPVLTGDPATTCIVSDVRMPGMSGLELQTELVRRGSPIPLILITGHGDIEMAVAAVKAGAHDFLEKPFNEKRLLSAIEAAIASQAESRVASQEIADLTKRLGDLSERQRQVMELAVKGRTNKEIGAELGISPRTVEIYRAKVMERMGADTLADLVRVAVLLDERKMQ